jgi:hypothetical protein
MLRGPKHSKTEVVVPEEEEYSASLTSLCVFHVQASRDRKLRHTRSVWPPTVFIIWSQFIQWFVSCNTQVGTQNRQNLPYIRHSVYAHCSQSAHYGFHCTLHKAETSKTLFFYCCTMHFDNIKIPFTNECTLY